MMPWIFPEVQISLQQPKSNTNRYCSVAGATWKIIRNKL